MILSCDPGDTTGWTIWSDDGQELYSGQMEADEFIEHLAQPDRFPGLKTVVYEDFRLFRGRAQAQTGSRFKASQVIGALKMLSSMTKAKQVRQETGNRDLGYKFMGEKQPTNHKISHVADARAHGYYYFVRSGIRLTKQQENQSPAATGSLSK